MKYKKVLVEWEDITFFRGKYTLSDIKVLEPTKMKTIGFLIQKKEKYLILAMSINEAEEFLDIFHIPNSVIKKIKVIK